jgi:hypothetical protein
MKKDPLFVLHRCYSPSLPCHRLPGLISFSTDQSNLGYIPSEAQPPAC